MKKLLFILSLFLIITSCNKTPIITLSVDKTEISANGKDFATFKVVSLDRHNNEDDVTKDCRIFFADSKKELGATTFSTTEPNTYSFYATYEDAVSDKVTVTAIEVVDEEEGNEDGDEDEDENEDENGNEEGNEEDENEDEELTEAPIVLSASTDTIAANDKDIITFTVMQDSLDVTDLAEIFVNDSLIKGNEFKTKVAGSYTAYAKKNDTIISNEITFFAKEIADENEDEEDEEEITPIILSASKTKIINDGKDRVTFTVTENDENITNSTSIYVGGNKLKLNIFTSKTAGTYTAYAMKGEVKSNEIVITVEDKNEQPENPEEPENPEQPETPENPEVPENPETPETPETPEQPEVPEAPIELMASTNSIIANGIDDVTFTVMQLGNDISTTAEIYVNNSLIVGNRYSTFTPGTYTAYARRNNVISNEITFTAQEAPSTGTSVVFADGVTINSGWYDVNKLKNGGGDINMCWAASASNIIQWWQDRYVAAGNTLPAGAVTGPGTKTYPEGYKYNLALMELYRDLWWNGKGGDTDHGVIWYFEGRNVQKYASEGSHAQPNDNTSGGYYSSIWNQILPKVYHEYKSNIFPNEFYNLISKEYNNYSNWGNGSGISGIQQLKKFSDLVVEFIDRGVISFVISLNSNGGLLHATTLWGYEIDNATGMLTKVWITDSDDMHQSGSGDPTQQKLQEYSVSYDGSKVKLSGAPYGNCWAISLLPVSGYGSAK